MLTFSVSIFFILFIDIYNIFSFLSDQYVGSVVPNLELGSVLLLCMLLQHAIAAASTSKQSVDCLVSQLRLKAQLARTRISVLKGALGAKWMADRT